MNLLFKLFSIIAILCLSTYGYAMEDGASSSVSSTKSSTSKGDTKSSSSSKSSTASSSSKGDTKSSSSTKSTSTSSASKGETKSSQSSSSSTSSEKSSDRATSAASSNKDKDSKNTSSQNNSLSSSSSKSKGVVKQVSSAKLNTGEYGDGSAGKLSTKENSKPESTSGTLSAEQLQIYRDMYLNSNSPENLNNPANPLSPKYDPVYDPMYSDYADPESIKVQINAMAAAQKAVLDNSICANCTSAENSQQRSATLNKVYFQEIYSQYASLGLDPINQPLAAGPMKMIENQLKTNEDQIIAGDLSANQIAKIDEAIRSGSGTVLFPGQAVSSQASNLQLLGSQNSMTLVMNSDDFSKILNGVEIDNLGSANTESLEGMATSSDLLSGGVIMIKSPITVKGAAGDVVFITPEVQAKIDHELIHAGQYSIYEALANLAPESFYNSDALTDGLSAIHAVLNRQVAEVDKNLRKSLGNEINYTVSLTETQAFINSGEYNKDVYRENLMATYGLSKVEADRLISDIEESAVIQKVFSDIEVAAGMLVNK